MAVGPSAPGWYADPQGQARYRYWDGKEWTGRVAASLKDVRTINRGKAVKPASDWTPSSPPSKEQDWFDKLLPWLIEDEKTGKTPLGQLTFFIAWMALTICMLTGGC